MKHKSICFVLIIICGNTLILSSTQLEKDKARQHIVVLKDQIKEEENEYNLAMQSTLNEIEKTRLTVQYRLKRETLFKEIGQQRDIINDRLTEKLFWDTATIVGPIALAGLIAYKFFTIPSTEVKPLIETINLPQTSTVSTPPMPLPEKLTLPLTKEEMQKYRNASKAYGATAVWFGVNALLFGPFFYPYATATILGSLYYSAKGLNLNLKPISLEQIKIMPQELPY